MASSSAREQAKVIAEVDDRYARNSLRVAYHLRRYVAVYVLGAAGLLTLAILPTVNGGSSGLAAGAGANTGGAYGAGRSASGAAGTAAGGGGPTGAAGVGGSGPAGSGGGAPIGATPGASPGGSNGAVTGPSAGGPTASGPVAAVHAGTGATVGGVPCGPGVAQLPYSVYADPCVAKFTGNNGGATYTGVTGSTITIGIRHTSDAQGPNAASVDAVAESAGGVSYETNETYIKALVAQFEKTFELYGRHLNLVDFNGQGNLTNEQTGTGQAEACADADAAANSVHAFTVWNWEGIFETEPFASCAATRYHMYSGEAMPYYPDAEFNQLDPYVWDLAPTCDLTDSLTGEFIGKQIAPFPAKWAGRDGALPLNGAQRKFAIYVPNNAGYSNCAATMIHNDEAQYHIASNRFDEYRYALDISQGPSDSNKAITQFAADRDTTIVLLSDPIAPIFLSQAAQQQAYTPEWMITGVAYTDQDNWAQLWEQQEMRGHLFGQSQGGSFAKAVDPNGEAARFVKAAGIPLNVSSAADYFDLLPVFDQLQAAGPILTPANIAAGTRELPQFGGPGAPVGTWYYGKGHTAIIDTREVYWNGSQTSSGDHKPGTYVEVYNGQRFRLGQYPSTEPPFTPS